MELRQYFRVTGISMAYVLAVQITLPVLAPYFQSLGYSESWISIVFGLFPLVSIVAGMIAGGLAKEFGRTWLVFIALIASAFSYAFYFIGIDWMIIVARLIDAFAFTVATVLLLAKAEDALDNQTRGKWTGILLSLEHIVRLVGPVLGGFLADKYIGYPFLLSIGIFLALAVALRHSHVHKKSSHLDVHPWKNVRWMWNNKELRPFLLLGPASHATGPAFQIVLPLFIITQLKMSYVDVGFAITAMGATHLLQFLFGQFSDVVGRKKFLIAGSLIAGLFMVTIGMFAADYWTLIVLLFVLGTGSAMWNVSAWSIMSDVAEKHGKESEVIGTYMSVAKVGQAVSFLVAGALIVLVGYSGVWIVLGSVYVLASIIAAAMWMTYKEKKKMLA